MNQKKILLIGPLPPPAGGVSIHIWRLQKSLKSRYLFDFVDEINEIKKDYFNLRSLRFWDYFRKIWDADLVHVHSGNNFLRIIHLVIIRVLNRKLVLTIHSYRKRKPALKRRVDELFYPLAHKIIVVNPDILEKLRLPENKCHIQNAFLPPLLEEEPDLPRHLMDWIEMRKSLNRWIICANASQLVTFQGEDVYGLDMCIAATKNARDLELPFDFIFVLASSTGKEDVLQKFRNEILESDLQEKFLLVNERLSFVRLMQQCDLVLRPTNTDGDALTIREALYLGKPVLASDVVKRPEGVLVFKNRNQQEMEKNIEAVFHESIKDNARKEARMVFSLDPYVGFYASLYDGLLTSESDIQQNSG